MKFVRHIPENTMTPWYYGHVYYDWMTGNSFKCLVPFHWPLRLWHYLTWKWRIVNNKPSKIDIMVSEVLAGLDRKWDDKFREELDNAVAVMRKQLLKQLKEAKQCIKEE